MYLLVLVEVMFGEVKVYSWDFWFFNFFCGVLIGVGVIDIMLIGFIVMFKFKLRGMELI